MQISRGNDHKAHARRKNRIAYISSVAYADVDISLLSSLQEYADVTYYLCVGPSGLRQTAIDLSSNKDLKDVFIWDARKIWEFKQTISWRNLLVGLTGIIIRKRA